METARERRKPGQGTIRTLRSGRKQVGITLGNGEREWSRTTYATEEEAESARVGLVEILSTSAAASTGGHSFAAYGRRILDRVERQQLFAPKTIEMYRNRFELYLATAAFAQHPIGSVGEHPFIRLMDGVDRDRARGTSGVVLAVARLIFAAASRDRLIHSDPTRGYRFPKRKRVEADDEETRSFFEPAQFEALAAAARHDERCMMRFAIATGIRLGEMITLHLRDVHADIARPFIDVKYGGRHGGKLQPTKGKKKRRVFLIGPALTAAREWIDEHLPRFKSNPSGLMFPSLRGEYRSKRRFLVGKSEGVERWQALLVAANLDAVTPALVWHSFRHTCATWLLSGLFGHKWAPEEVQNMLGHEDLKTTLGYAKVVDDRLADVAAKTRGGGGRGGGGGSAISRRSNEAQARETVRDAQEATLLCANRGLASSSATIAALRDRAVIAIAHGEIGPAVALAEAVLALPVPRLALAVLEGGPFQATRAVELAEALRSLTLAAPEARQA